jgi:hypothetical protein
MNRELLVVDSLLPMLEEGTWQGDLDVGEMFYNYLLDPAIQQFCGVDIDPYLGNKASPARMSWLLWRQCVMGLNTYPHGCIRMHSLAEEFVHGQWMVVNNPFYYESITLISQGPHPTTHPNLGSVSSTRWLELSPMICSHTVEDSTINYKNRVFW